MNPLSMISRAHPLPLTLALLVVGANCNDSTPEWPLAQPPAPDAVPTADPATPSPPFASNVFNILDIEASSATSSPNPIPLIATSETKIVPPDGKASDLFGYAVAIDRDTLVIGTPYEDSAAQDAGAAYVFVRTNGMWMLEQKLVSPNPGAGQWFGYAVAIDGDKTVIGTPQSNGNTVNAGAAYVFSRSSGVWTSLPRLAASDGKPGDMFGQAVDIVGNSVLVGSPNSDTKGADAGAAYVFFWNGNAYVEQKKILTTDSTVGDHFGFAVAMHGETALIGAPDADVFGIDSGTAYVFFREGTLWSQQKKLISPQGAAGDGFGRAVDIFADTALVGSPLDDAGGLDAGATYVFQRTGISWNPDGNLAPKGLADDDRFGSSVAMNGNTILVGAMLDDSAAMNAGSAYVFKHNGFSWYQTLEVLASDAATGDSFGFSVGISGQTAVVGAYLDDDLGTSSGAAYIYEFRSEGGERCVTGGECLSGFCADGVCCDTACDQGQCDACSVAAGSKFAGVCKLLDGVVCNDGNACTQTDTCLAGQCVGKTPKICGSDAACSGASMCDPATGMCVGQLTPNGTTCDDDNACTSSDSCQQGACVGATHVECPADACHKEGTCDPASGTCSAAALPDGTVCPGGVCQAGACVPPHTEILISGGGCFCRAGPYERAANNAQGVGIIVALWGLMRARKKAQMRRTLSRVRPQQSSVCCRLTKGLE